MRKEKILAVDDEPVNIAILQRHLTGAGFEVVTGEDGDVALQRLSEHPDIDVIVLDRMMPRLNGMEVLKRLKENDRLRGIPVIMQTAAAGTEQMLEGIRAGVYYYLTKPYEDAMLISIVRAALDDVRSKREMREEVHKHRRMAGLMTQARFRFRTLEEARNLAYFIAGCFADPEAAVYGLHELMINAVEHGNLGITYADKTQLMLDGAWRHEVTRRLALPENLHKYARLAFEADDKEIRVRIRDEGAGFNWKNYLEIAPGRATDPHGRGIATACMMSFASVEYLGKGNEVLCTVKLNGANTAQ